LHGPSWIAPRGLNMTTRTMNVGRRIRALREKRKVTLNQLSSLTGVAASTLSAMEHNKSSPTLNTLIKIAEAFQMKVGEFLDHVAYEKATLRRPGEEIRMETLSPDHDALLLTAELPESRLECAKITLGPVSDFELTRSQDAEFLLHCLTGKVTASVDDQDFRLEPGFSLHVPPGPSVILRNSGPGEATLLAANTPRIHTCPGPK